MRTTRRKFLVGGLSVTAAVPFLSSASLARRDGGERVLVVLQLTGGNDGLNTVVPHRQDAYYRLRPTLARRRSDLAPLDGDHGFAPGLAPLAELYAAGDLACVHGAGPPTADRSHFRSMEIWHTAETEEPPSAIGHVGWLGRLADQLAERDPTTMAAVHVGDEDLPLALWGESYRAPTVRDPEGFRLRGPSRGRAAFERGRAELLRASGGGDSLAFLREAAASAYDAAERMAALAEARSAVEYPGTGLARRMRLVARLVTGGFGTRVFQVTLGGFDTHARQRLLHDDLLSEVGGALGAFQRDLQHHGFGDRVATLVFSEFGRRAAENASGGTDHGAGAPALVIGGGVAGGMLGTPPRLDELADGDVPSTTDFRRIYAALERDWMGLAPSTGARPLSLFG